MDSIEIFTIAGKALFPHKDWKNRMAEVLGVRRDTVRDWANGRRGIPLAIIEKLQELLDQRIKEVKIAETDLVKWLVDYS
jgi:hypothetical protein